MYTIIYSEKFEKNFFKIIPRNLQKDIIKRINLLANNPYIGKPLGYSHIRELKAKKFRIYFIIYEKEITILMADVSDKKQQQKTISILYKNIRLFQELVKNLNKRDLK